VIREALRLLWHTIRHRRSTPDQQRPGTDDQFATWPRIRIADYLNPEDQQDNDERTWKP
jgi:hypothetical protein